MASKHKPALPLIPIPPNPLSYHQPPRTGSTNAFSSPQLSKIASKPQKPSEEDFSQIDPDDLFIRFTIPEIKAIQSKLRLEADAKREELRLMVGERYRDLLQASTSIISIADSSRHVLSALADMRAATVSDEPQRKPPSSLVRGKDDAHLKVLQSLSAHIKLLLDAPEHIWRLLEKNQHLEAAWLFLLARVVHRALVTEDSEEGSWEREGIHVMVQFPLVQRQWESVAQFRLQIAHRAMQYLREVSISSESACSVILTLHLLDSLPLTETLTTLLSQRSRTLNGLLSRKLDLHSTSCLGPPSSKSDHKKREHPNLLQAAPSLSIPKQSLIIKVVVRDSVIDLLNVICGTMRTARDIFRADGDENSRKSMAERSLEDLQSDAPPEGVLTTSKLLFTLPSSAHLLTLPPSILSYRPYIDLTSPSTHVDSTILNTKLSTWFDKAMGGLEDRIQVWFAGLESIREVWGLRRKVLERLQCSQGLVECERVTMRSIVDNCVKVRVGEVAGAALDDLAEQLGSALRHVIQGIRDGVEDSKLDLTPTMFLFSAPPIPSHSQLLASSSPPMSPFKLFKNDLRQRVDRRTPSLNRVVGQFERGTREIESNFRVMNEDNNESRELRDQIVVLYHKAAQASITRICQILEQIMNEEIGDHDREPDQAVSVGIFVGRLCYYISSSPCMSSLCCRADTTQAFRETLNCLHERSLNHWRTHAVSKALMEYGSETISPSPADVMFPWPNQPSSRLISAFMSIMTSLDRLGLSRMELITKGDIHKTLRDFQSALAANISTDDHFWGREEAQLLWDLTFLLQLSPSESTETETALAAKLSGLRSHLQSMAPSDTFPKLDAHIDHTIALYLPRSQTLLAPLLTGIMPIPKAYANGSAIGHATTRSKTKATTLLPFGTPEADQDYRIAIETAKPSARFGMLLVGNTTVR